MFCSDTCNLLFAHLLFWVIAVPMVAEHGYSTNKISEAIDKQGVYGELKSGRFGQGAFPILLMLTFVATGIWTAGLVSLAVDTVSCLVECGLFKVRGH